MLKICLHNHLCAKRGSKEGDGQTGEEEGDEDERALLQVHLGFLFSLATFFYVSTSRSFHRFPALTISLVAASARNMKSLRIFEDLGLFTEQY